MVIRQKVALEGVRFFAFHGFYPEEQLTGNEFMVDIVTEWDVSDDGHNDINITIIEPNAIIQLKLHSITT